MALKSNITLQKYRWIAEGDVFSTGFTWFKNEYIDGEKFHSLISENSGSFEGFREFTEKLNGQFSIVVQKESEVWMFCSHTWSYPLFYSKTEENLSVSDAPETLGLNSGPTEIDSVSKPYFLQFGVTPTSHTLHKDISQIQPGEVIRFRTKKTDCFSTLPFTVPDRQEKNELSTPEKFHSLIIKTFERYFNYLKNKQILLPLTKGYDSRLLGCLLKEFGHENVICATWGRQDNIESSTARKVAKQLGYPHIFIEYNNDLIENFISEDNFFPYVDFAGHLSSMPYFQDYFAIKELVKNKTIDSETVALPGHPGDFLRGAHLDRKMEENDISYFLSKIIGQLGFSYPSTKRELYEIKENIQESFFENKKIPHWKNFERWDFSERQCKFIENSTQVFPFFGINYLMPLFDTDILRYGAKIPFEQKVGERLYNQTLENRFFKKHKVDFDLKPESPDGQSFNPVKAGLLKNLPIPLKNWYYPLNDTAFYREITHELRENEPKFTYKHPLKPHSYNSYVIQWYLQVCTKKGV